MKQQSLQSKISVQLDREITIEELQASISSLKTAKAVAEDCVWWFGFGFGAGVAATCGSGVLGHGVYL